MIKVANINFAYTKTPILQNISFIVQKGDWLGLLGPNGSGKTTLLKCLSGILKPQSGTIELTEFTDHKRTNEPTNQRTNALLIAVVPQETSITFPFTVAEIVLMGRQPYYKKFGFETAHDIKIAEDSMRLTDTWQFRNRQFNELSGGERQRVIIARALAQEPKILLLDEPTAFLDIRHQQDILKLLKKLNEECGLTIVSAMHDINLALLYCKTIALLKNGRILNIGSPNEVVTFANLKDVFETEVYVGINDLTGKAYYLPYFSPPL